jgi:hypothetical protein
MKHADKPAAVFTADDFRAARGRIVFASGPGSILQDQPAPAHIAAWNRRVRLPPAAVADFFGGSFAEIPGLNCAVAPRIVFSVKNKKSDPSMLFEVWRKGAALPERWDGTNHESRIFRANRILRAGSVYGMWCGVTGDFNNAGKKLSLRQKGIGKAIQATLMPLFMAMGYKRFDLHASSEGSHKGAYIWPRFGAEVAPKTTGTVAGLDTLTGTLREKFRAVTQAQAIPAAVQRRVNNVLDHPDPRLLVRLAGIRCAIDDPDNSGQKAQLTEVMLRGQYIKCHFDFESAAWQKYFFNYVGVDRRPELQQHLAHWQQKSPS